MKYYVIEPEVAGGLGEHTVIDRSTGRSVVKKLHYQFDGWRGDELLESAPCYIVSERMSDEIKQTKLTGVRFDEVETTTSDQFRQMHPDRQLPKFVWMKVDGTPGHDDFGMAPGLQLVVSGRAIQILKRIGISNAASIAPFEAP